MDIHLLKLICILFIICCAYFPVNGQILFRDMNHMCIDEERLEEMVHFYKIYKVQYTKKNHKRRILSRKINLSSWNVVQETDSLYGQYHKRRTLASKVLHIMILPTEYFFGTRYPKSKIKSNIALADIEVDKPETIAWARHVKITGQHKLEMFFSRCNLFFDAGPETLPNVGRFYGLFNKKNINSMVYSYFYKASVLDKISWKN